MRNRDMSGAVFVVAVLLALFAVGVAQGSIDYCKASLPLTGGTMTGALVLPDGAVGAPSLRFAASATTGIYTPGAGIIDFTASGTQRLRIAASVSTQADVLPQAGDSYALGSIANQWLSLHASRSIQGSESKALTDAGAAVSIERVAVPTNGYVGQLTSFTANSTDGTNRLTTTGLVSWAAADTAGTVTCGAPVVVGLSTAYKRANTLVCTFTAVTATTNCDLQVTCTDNLAAAQTMAIEHFIVSMPSPNTYTQQ